jgi:hypothetical protein
LFEHLAISARERVNNKFVSNLREAVDSIGGLAGFREKSGDGFHRLLTILFGEEIIFVFHKVAEGIDATFGVTVVKLKDLLSVESESRAHFFWAFNRFFETLKRIGVLLKVSGKELS